MLPCKFQTHPKFKWDLWKKVIYMDLLCQSAEIMFPILNQMKKSVTKMAQHGFNFFTGCRCGAANGNDRLWNINPPLFEVVIVRLSFLIAQLLKCDGPALETRQLLHWQSQQACLSHLCSASAESQGSSSARPHLIYQGKEWQNCDHANAPAWKIQEPNDKPWCAGADRGRKRGTTWHSLENCESAVSACRLR